MMNKMQFDFSLLSSSIVVSKEMNLNWIIVLVLLIGVVNCDIKDYCEPRYCPNADTKHSACETSGVNFNSGLKLNTK